MRIEANTRQFERELKRLQRLNNNAARRMGDSHAIAARRSDRAWRNASQQLKSYAGVLAAAFSGREILRAADTYQRFTNQLMVAGVAGEQLGQVQNELFEIAQKNGVALEGLGELYGNAAQVQNDLGASSEQLITLTEASSAALRITGKTAAQASGALLGLSQALASGTVKAEEYNQMNEGGLRPLLQVIANTDQFGGSLGKLRQAVVDGTVTSREFFNLVVDGAAALEEKAAKAPLTVAQAFTTLSNAFTKYIGEASQATGASAVMVSAIESIADNLPTLINALTVIAGLYGASFIPAIARSSTALAANGIAMASTAAVYSTSTRSILAGASAMNAAKIAGSGLLAVLGGPLGIALTGLAAGMAYFAVKNAEAEAESRALSAAIADNAAKLGTLDAATANAAGETAKLSNEQIIQKAGAVGLKIETQKLTNAKYADAAATRLQYIEELRLQRLRAAKTYLKAYRETKSDVSGLGAAMGKSGGFLGVSGDLKSQANPDAAWQKLMDSQAYKDFTQADKNYKAALDNPIEIAAPQTAVGGGGSSNAKRKSGGRGRGPSDGSEKIAQLELEILREKLSQAKTIEARAALERDILAIEKQQTLDSIQQDVSERKLTQIGAEQLIAKEGQLAALKSAAIAAQEAEEIQRRESDIAFERADLQATILEMEADGLEDTALRSRNLEQRYNLLWSALDKRQKAERLSFDLSQKQYELDLQKLGLTQEQIDNMLAQRERVFNAGQTQDANRLGDREASDKASVGDRIEGYANSFGTLNDQLGSIAIDGIDNLTSSLTAAVMGTKSLKEAFADMAKAIIADLVAMAVKFVIFEAIGMALGIPGLGKAAIGLGGSKAGSAEVGSNQSGTNHWRGGLTMVGEAGPELVNLPRGSQVLPNSTVRSAQALVNGGATRGGASVVSVHTTVNAQDAVLTDQVKSWVAQGSAEAVKAAQELTLRKLSKDRRNNLYQT